MLNEALSAAAILPPVLVKVNWPLTGPILTAFGVVATTETSGGLSAMVTVAAAVPMMYVGLA